MKNKGQALIEFVLILPVFILLLFGMIDFGLIINRKCVLESKMKDVMRLKDDHKSIDDIKVLINRDQNTVIDVIISEQDDEVIIDLSTSYTIMTPGINLILGNPYIIHNQRFYYE